MAQRALLACSLLCASPALAVGAATDFAYVREAGPALAAGAVPVDTREPRACLERSFTGARCLAATEFLGPHRALAPWRDVLWLLGTAGLRGDETVLVAGDKPVERDFVAGLLYLAGCRRVLVLAEPVSKLLDRGAEAGPGNGRAFAREVVLEAPMRDALVVLGHELRGMRPPPLLLDGRSEDEYWGEKVRAARGGHLPGAQSLPAARLQGGTGGAIDALPAAPAVAYAHDALEGIAYFTRLRAGRGVDARVYPGGWAEWAADAALPADAVTYPDRPTAAARGEPDSGRAKRGTWLAGAVAVAGAAFAGGLLFGRHRPG